MLLRSATARGAYHEVMHNNAYASVGGKGCPLRPIDLLATDAWRTFERL